MQSHLSPIRQGSPVDLGGRCAQEIACYTFLDALGIDYQTVDHAAATTIADCAKVEQVLGTAIYKNLFLCNRQKTDFYLLLMPADKPFRTAVFSKAVSSSRLSFASDEDMMRLLGVTPGSVTVLGLLFDKDGQVRLCVDEELLSASHLGLHPCKNTSSIKVSAPDLFHRIIPALSHDMTVVSLPRGEHP